MSTHSVRRYALFEALLGTIIVAAAVVQALAGEGAPAEKKSKPGTIRQLVFSEQLIKGKVRRPQLVLIKAEQRPSFPPMALQAIGGQTDVVSEEIARFCPYSKPFELEGTNVVNCVP
jgi:hypothetical protein